MTTPLTSQASDGLHTALPLRHALYWEMPGGFRVERGGVLENVVVCYETYGRLNSAGDNAVLICHGFSGDSHVARHDASDDPGWWDLAVGPGKAIDTDRYFVICPNVLGGCRGTTGPNCIDVGTGRRYGASFPAITITDMVEVQRRLIDHLGIEQLWAVVGGSLGGHLALMWAVKYPERVQAIAAIATSPRLTSQALAFDVVGRNAILRDPGFHGGQFYDTVDRPSVGLAIARMLGHITYLSNEAMSRKFDADRLNARSIPTDFETRFSVGSYLAHQGDKFVERFDANSYITLSTAMDLFDLGSTPAEIAENLGRSKCRWLLISFSSDWLFPPSQSRQIVDALLSLSVSVSYCDIHSDGGHDAFLLAKDLPLYGGMVRAFLDHQQGISTGATASTSPGDSTSIFHHRRLDYDTILQLIPPGSSVLDLGCGRGGLLSRLRDRGHRQLLGIELNEREILTTLSRGLNVVQADLNHGLPSLTEGQFDVVVLSQTLQAVTAVAGVLEEMLRIGRLCIVSFPNVAYGPLREQLAVHGRSPRGTELQGQNWHNTPNLRFLSIADFEDFCRERHIRIHRMDCLNTEEGREVTEDPNRNADTAVIVFSR